MAAGLRLVGWNVGLIVLCLVVLDLVFGSWVHDGFYNPLNAVRSVDLTLDVSQLYSDPDGTARYSRDEWGLRGPHDTPGEIDILTIGGSTTDQLYISDGETWQDVLGREAATEGVAIIVSNAGVDGHSTFGHLEALDRWLSDIEGLHPALVLFYVGNNDVLLDRPNIMEEARGVVDHFRERSAIYHAARTVRGMREARRAGVLHAEHRRRDGMAWTDQPALDDHEALAEPMLQAYERRIAVLAERARVLGWVPVFVTQPSRFAKTDAGTRVGAELDLSSPWGPMNGLDRAIFLDLYNAATLRAASEAGAIGIDLGESLLLEDDDFYDVVHTTPAGAEKIGRFLYQALVRGGSLGRTVSGGRDPHSTGDRHECILAW